MLNVVEKAPEEPITAVCVATPSSVTTTFSPRGVCPALARVPEKVALEVP